MKGDGLDSSPERLHLPCSTVQTLIQEAYGNFADDRFNAFASVSISGGPDWMNSALYQIDAKAESPQSRGTMNGSMLRALLADRFKLRTHRDLRDTKVYVLTVAKNGPKLRPYKEGTCVALDMSDPDHLTLPKVEPGQSFPLVCGMGRLSDKGYDLPRATMATFCRDISSKLDRPLIDKSGLDGVFDIHLELSEAELRAGDPASIVAAVKSAIKRLGLDLEPATAPEGILVIDHIERPTEN
jgi:uncharacterized protein (TIGR03435 family)